MKQYSIKLRWDMHRPKTFELHSTAYDLQDMMDAWKQNGQGHKAAKERGDQCVIISGIDEICAAKLSRDFCENYFNIPTCTHWNGKTLSLYCGDAGSGTSSLQRQLKADLNSIGYII